MRSVKMTLMISCAIFAVLWISQVISKRELAAELDKLKADSAKLTQAYLSMEALCTSSSSADSSADEPSVEESEPQVQ